MVLPLRVTVKVNAVLPLLPSFLFASAAAMFRVGFKTVVVVGGTDVVEEVVMTVVVVVVVVVGRMDVVEVVTVIGLKLAVIVIFAFIVAVHSPVPLHPPPDQPPKIDPGAAVAERDTTVPAL